MRLKFLAIIVAVFFAGANAFGQPDSVFNNAVKGMTKYRGGISIFQNADRFYFEFPASLFEKDILWYAEIKSGPLVTGAMASSSSSGQIINSIMIRLEKRDGKVFVRENTTPLDLRLADVPMSPADRERMQRSLKNINTPAVLLAIPVIATGADGNVLVDVSSLLKSNLSFFDVTKSFPGLTMADPNRSYIDFVKSFSNNIRFNVTLTCDVMASAGVFMDMMAKINSRSASVTVAHSIYILPEQKMMPRLADSRIGYFDNGFTELQYGSGYATKAYISKYRLEKKNPNAKLSEPVKPIVYYIGPDVPSKWRPAFKTAVEYWNKAYEAIGFKNAILAKDPPDDPNWSAEDLGHSVIRWVNQPVANANGPRTVDPRTGEILSAHIMIWEDVFTMATQWYYLQGFGSDKRAAKLPLPDDIAQALMKYIVAHEIGHSIGLRHNHRASQVYTTAELRDKKFTDMHGSVGSIMSYGRINYIAQPGDGVTNLIPQLGPYDFFAIKYGYEPISSANSPEAEIPTLNKWLEQQRTDNKLLWSAEDKVAYQDPMVITENLGNDRIDAARLGLLNLQRAVDNLPNAIGQSPQDINLLMSYYKAAIGERDNWLLAATKELYGFMEFRYQDPRQYEFITVPADRKKQVLEYLLGELKTVSPLFTEEMRRLFPPDELVKMITSGQISILSQMTGEQVFLNMNINAALGHPDYSPSRYLEDIANAIFAELNESQVNINPVRRNLQYTLVAQLISFLELKYDSPIAAIVQPAARKVLAGLLDILKAAPIQNVDIETQSHIKNLVVLVSKSLN